MQATNTLTPLALTDVFPADAVRANLDATTKEEVIAQLVHRLVELGHVAAQDEAGLVQIVLTRERLGTTAMGNGLAFPHGRSITTNKIVGAVGLVPKGIPFNALDGEPVHAVFLVLTPPARGEQHVEVLSRITALGRDRALRLQLRGCRSAEAVQRVLAELDRQEL